MSTASRAGSVTILAAAIAAMAASPAAAQNHAPNPYTTLEHFAPLPDGRSWGSTSAVEVSPDGETIWAIDRCGENSCDTDVPGAERLDIVFEFDKDGNILTPVGRRPVRLAARDRPGRRGQRLDRRRARQRGGNERPHRQEVQPGRGASHDARAAGDRRTHAGHLRPAERCPHRPRREHLRGRRPPGERQQPDRQVHLRRRLHPRVGRDRFGARAVPHPARAGHGLRRAPLCGRPEQPAGAGLRPGGRLRARHLQCGACERTRDRRVRPALHRRLRVELLGGTRGSGAASA